MSSTSPPIEETSPPPDTPRNEDEEGEDLLENAASDYKAQPELDKYDEEDINDEDVSPMDIAQRRNIDQLLQTEIVEWVEGADNLFRINLWIKMKIFQWHYNTTTNN